MDRTVFARNIFWQFLLYNEIDKNSLLLESPKARKDSAHTAVKTKTRITLPLEIFIINMI